MVNWSDRRNREASYSDSTPVEVRRFVDAHLAEKMEKPPRMLFHYNDGSTASGYVSKGVEDSAPKIVHNTRSPGGRPLRDADIVKIEASRKKRGVRDTLYTHPKYRESQ